jgi:hypothetical protein
MATEALCLREQVESLATEYGANSVRAALEMIEARGNGGRVVTISMDADGRNGVITPNFEMPKDLARDALAIMGRMSTYPV